MKAGLKQRLVKFIGQIWEKCNNLKRLKRKGNFISAVSGLTLGYSTSTCE